MNYSIKLSNPYPL